MRAYDLLGRGRLGVRRSGSRNIYSSIKLGSIMDRRRFTLVEAVGCDLDWDDPRQVQAYEIQDPVIVMVPRYVPVGPSIRGNKLVSQELVTRTLADLEKMRRTEKIRRLESR